jgi:recombination protein RecA
MMKALQDLKRKIESNVKGVHVSVLADSNIASERDWIQSPCYDLNRILSGSFYRGIPNRMVVGIVGPEASMKSSFMVLCMVEAQKKGYMPVIIDTEGGINDSFCLRWGLDIEKCLYIYTPWVEEVTSLIGQLYHDPKSKNDSQKYIIGIDSAGNLNRKKALKDAREGKHKQDQGLLQKDLKSMFKLLLALAIQQDSIGIVCGHLYGSPGSSVPMPDQVGGGKAMRYLPRILINLKKEYIKDDNKQIIGTRLKAHTLKNWLYPPFQEATVDIDYKRGIDPYAGIVDLAIDAGIIVANPPWYDVGDDKKIQGKEALKEYLENGETLAKLEEWIANTGYSTVNKEIEEAIKIIEDEDGLIIDTTAKEIE